MTFKELLDSLNPEAEIEVTIYDEASDKLVGFYESSDDLPEDLARKKVPLNSLTIEGIHEIYITINKEGK